MDDVALNPTYSYQDDNGDGHVVWFLDATTLFNAVKVDFDGAGEVLRGEGLPTSGKRSLKFDPDTGLISGQTYDVLPSSYVIQRYGQKPGLVALTFDDGPDAPDRPGDVRRRPAGIETAGRCRGAHQGLRLIARAIRFRGSGNIEKPPKGDAPGEA